MSMKVNNSSLYIPLLAKRNSPITVDWSTTIQTLSTDLQGYELTLELTTTEKMLIEFFNGNKTAVLKAEEPLTRFEILRNSDRLVRFAHGASVVVGILVGQTTLDKAADLVRGLSATHELKADHIKAAIEKEETITIEERTFIKETFKIEKVHKSFSVKDVHQLAQSLKDC